MLPAIAIVGRPNVGKSTLFNRLTSSRDALVANQPGLTRDRQYGYATRGEYRAIVVDTGGFTDERNEIMRLTAEQALLAELESDLIVFMVDGREGVNALDEMIAERLRRHGKPTILAVNKTDGIDAQAAILEFHRLGIEQLLAISAAHGRGVVSLWTSIARVIRPQVLPPSETEHGIKFAIIGRPNVGKSTLVNTILGEHRVIAHDLPGTTRDSIYIPFDRRDSRYTIIDTAGVRRRAKVDSTVEKYSVIKTLRALDECHVAVVLVDAQVGITDQDLRLLGLVVESGRGLVLAINKCDSLNADQKPRLLYEIDRKFRFLDFAAIHQISALNAWGIKRLLVSVDMAWKAAHRDLATPTLTKLLSSFVQRHPPPLVRGRRIKLRYAHQGGKNPPVIVIHGNQTSAVSESYRRYLANQFRDSLDLKGTPVRIEFKNSENPFKGKRNPLTERQLRRRRRLIRHIKKSAKT